VARNAVKTYQAEHVAQKARKKVEAKVRKEAKKKRIAKEKKKKKTLEYLQQLQNKILAEETALLNGTRGSQVIGTKHRKTTSGNEKK